MTRYSGPSRRPGETLEQYLRRRRREAAAIGPGRARARITIAEAERLATAAGKAWPAAWLRRACRDLRRRKGYGDAAFMEITLASALDLFEAAQGRPALPGLKTEDAQ